MPRSHKVNLDRWCGSEKKQREGRNKISTVCWSLEEEKASRWQVREAKKQRRDENPDLGKKVERVKWKEEKSLREK